MLQDSCRNYARTELDYWADIVIGDQPRAWPAETLLGRMIRCGLWGAAQQGRQPADMPDRAAIVDAIVAKLSPLMKKVIFAQYLTYAPSEVKARSCDLSKRHYFRLVARAERKVYEGLEMALTVCHNG